MRWTPGGGAGIEDRRGLGAGTALPVGGGLIGLVLWLVLSVLGGGGGGFSVPGVDALPRAEQNRGAPPPARTELVEFVSFVVDDVQSSWQRQFTAAGRPYEPTTLVLFTDAVRSGCGVASAASGPFYCPADRKMYLDLTFFQDLARRHGAPGDFAQAYVIAHEFGHHVQTLLGISEEVNRLAQRSQEDANELSIRQELQADCLAGVWGYTTADRGLLEPGDLEEGLDAAAAVGDDRLQRQAGDRVNPERWTHGSSKQRVEWFRRGFESGDPDQCDTFGGEL